MVKPTNQEMTAVGKSLSLISQPCHMEPHRKALGSVKMQRERGEGAGKACVVVFLGRNGWGSIDQVDAHQS